MDLNKKAFTLVEVLGVLVIMAIIALITIPLTVNILDTVRKNSFESSVYGIVRTAQNEYYVDDLKKEKKELVFMYNDGEEISNVIGKSLEYTGKRPVSGNVVIKADGNTYLTLYDGTWCATKAENSDEVVLTKVSAEECINTIDMPQIILNGDATINLEIKQTYIEPGYRAISTTGKDITDDVKVVIKKNDLVVKSIDSDVPNNYVILYSVEEDGKYRQVVRTVNVVDSVPPELSVPTTTTLTVEQVPTFNPMDGVTYVDNSGNDLTIKVSGSISAIPGTYTLTYRVTDLAGNTTTKTRKIIVIDNNAPIITILGDNPYDINYGETYVDPGATATDNVDGDLTSSIVKTGNLSTIPGTYTITYKVTDSSGNESSAERTINVIDNVGPVITLETNGNSTWAKTQSTKVTVSDNVAVNNDTLKYIWTTSATEPGESLFTSLYSNGATITSPAGVSGNYYLYVMAKDNSGNKTVLKSNVFNIDNTVPTCGTITGASTSWTSSDRTISVACTDNAGCSQSSFSKTFNTTLQTSNITISDIVGNTNTCPVNVYVDKTNYAITISQKTGGTIYAKSTSSNTTAKMGESIKVTVSVASGYQLTSLTWNGSGISNGGTYTMPRSNVTITATYKATTAVVYNLITNGGFESDWNGWYDVVGGNGNMSIWTSDAYEGSKFAFFSPQEVGTWAQKRQIISSVSGHIYYASLYVKTPYIGASGARLDNFTDSSIEISDPSKSWIKVSGYLRATKSTSADFVIGALYNHIGQAYYIDNVLLIDVTANFGAGLEPSQAWLDANVPYFEGSRTVNKP